MKKSLVRKVALSLCGFICLGNIMPVSARGGSFVGEYPQGEILSFGSSLNKEQEAKLREKFGVDDDVEAIYVTTEVAVKQLGLDKSAINTYKGGWYSSAYVKLTKGDGMNVKADNLTLVTEDMLANALITSGIVNADVIASSPFKVTGESALAGILAGVEEIIGDELTQENKETAQKEIETTLDVADEIGQKEASTIMNEIKAEVIKDSPITNIQIENIVINVTQNYGVELSDKTRQKVVSTMSDINSLDINYKDVKSALKSVSEKLFGDLKDALKKGDDIGMKIKESGIFDKIWTFFKDMFNSFLDLFRGNDSTDNDGSQDVDSEEVTSPNEENVPSTEGSVEEDNLGVEDESNLDENNVDSMFGENPEDLESNDENISDEESVSKEDDEYGVDLEDNSSSEEDVIKE